MKVLTAVFTGLTLAGAALTARAQSVGIGPAGYTPDTNAALDISAGSSSNKGLLVPRLTEAQRTAATTSTEGMLIYQTNGTQPGFWYYTGGTWVPLPSGVASGAGWLTTGNSGTAPGTFTGVGASTNGTGGTSFVGTTDNKDLVFRTGNTERLRITTDGSLYSRSAYGLILNASDAPLITRGWDAFQTGSYAGLGRWGLFMTASQLAAGIPDAGGKTFGWLTWNDNSTISKTLMTLTREGYLGIGLNGTASTIRLSLAGDGTPADPATANAAQSSGHLARFRDNGNVTLDLGSSGTTTGLWLQSTNATNLAANYPLRLNPNGGNVGIGTGTATPGSTLTVAGTASVSGPTSLASTVSVGSTLSVAGAASLSGPASLGSTLNVAVSTAIGGGASGSGTLLSGYNAIYLGLSPTSGNADYNLPDPSTCPGRIYYLRNNSNAQDAYLTLTGYAAGTRQLYNGNGSGGFQFYTLAKNSAGKTIICLSDGANWTIGQVN